MNIYAINKSKINSLEETYRNHKLISYVNNGKYVGEVYKHDVKVAYCESAGITASIQYSRTIVDQLIKQRVLKTHNNRLSRKRLRKALVTLLPSIGSEQRSLLLFQVIHNNMPADLDSLKNAAGCTNTTEIYLQLADFARTLCDELAFEPPKPIDGRDPYIAFIVEPEINYANTSESIKLTLSENVFRALKSINWR